MSISTNEHSKFYIPIILLLFLSILTIILTDRKSLHYNNYRRKNILIHNQYRKMWSFPPKSSNNTISKPKTAIISMGFGSPKIRNLTNLVNYNKILYAKIQNYDFHFYDERLTVALPAVWSKLDALLYSMSDFEYDYVVWLDADAQVMDLTVGVEEVVRWAEFYAGLDSDSADVLIACDTNGLNFGATIFKNSQKTRKLLNQALTQYYYLLHWQQEQISFSSALSKMTISDNLKIIYLSRKFFNSYLGNYNRDTTWIAHTPNCQSRCYEYALRLDKSWKEKLAESFLEEKIDYLPEFLRMFLSGQKGFISRREKSKVPRPEGIEIGLTNASSKSVFRPEFVKSSCEGSGL